MGLKFDYVSLDHGPFYVLKNELQVGALHVIKNITSLQHTVLKNLKK